VAASVDLVVHVAVEAGGKRRVREIVAVPGRVESDVIETEPIFVTQGGRLVRVQGMPPRLERFEIAGIDLHHLLASEPAVNGEVR
jgi:pilus assembly protein CpaF